MLVIAESQLRLMVGNIIASAPAAGLLGDVALFLYVNDYTPTPDMVLADFTEASFDGYASSSAVVWGPTFLDTNGRGASLGDTKNFDCTGSTVQEQVFGYYIADFSTGATVIGAEKFSVPYLIEGDQSFVAVAPVFRLSQPA